MAFKFIRGLAPPYSCSKFKTRDQVHDRNTKNKKSLEIPLCKSAAGQRSFYYRATRVWNNLPDGLKDSTLNMRHFEHGLKDILLAEFFEV